MPKITEDHIMKALYLSKKSPVHKKFGCLLIYKGKVISKGFNHYNKGIADDIRYCLFVLKYWKYMLYTHPKNYG